MKARTVHYNVKASWWTVEGAYENWVATREPPLFGTEPDARVWALALEAADQFRSVINHSSANVRKACSLIGSGQAIAAMRWFPFTREALGNKGEKDRCRSMDADKRSISQPGNCR